MIDKGIGRMMNMKKKREIETPLGRQNMDTSLKTGWAT
jgi:hypothetical protein